MHKQAVALATFMAAFTAGAAEAGVYIVDQPTTPGITLSGTITTDGTLGDLGFANFTDLDITVTDGLGSDHLGLADLVDLGGFGSSTKLFATSSGLFFDFSSSAAEGFAVINFSTLTAYCMTAGGITCAGTGNSQLMGPDGRFSQGPILSSLLQVAHASPTPEPASWAMMVGGFGLIGGAMRSRRKAAVSFA